MENGPFEDVFPIENCDFTGSYVSLPKKNWAKSNKIWHLGPLILFVEILPHQKWCENLKPAEPSLHGPMAPVPAAASRVSLGLASGLRVDRLRVWPTSSITHTIHVWYIYLHLLDFYGKLRR